MQEWRSFDLSQVLRVATETYSQKLFSHIDELSIRRVVELHEGQGTDPHSCRSGS